jgi:glycosyltransferase involved in cell wall biosynthesis
MVLMLCFVFPPRFSGAATQALSLAVPLRDHGVQCEFIAPNFSDRLPYTFRKDRGFNIHRLGWEPWSFAILFFMFLAIRARRYSVLHIHGFSKSQFICVALGRLFRMQIVQKMTKGGSDNSEIGHSGLLAPLRRLTLGLVNNFIAISSPLYLGISELGLTRSRVHHIPNGVDVSRFTHRGTDERRKVCSTYRLQEGDILLLCAGVIDRRKNQHLILQAIHVLRSQRPELWQRISLVMAGPLYNKTYSDEVIRYARETTLDTRVHFPGAVSQDELAKLNGICDICVFAGNNEGLPNALLEAQSAGMPIVAFQADGIDDVVRDGYDGYIVPFGNVDLFSQQLAQLIENPLLRQRFGENATNNAIQKFSLDRIAQRYIQEVYQIGTQTRNDTTNQHMAVV